MGAPALASEVIFRPDAVARVKLWPSNRQAAWLQFSQVQSWQAHESHVQPLSQLSHAHGF